jgi:hypothetical protein
MDNNVFKRLLAGALLMAGVFFCCGVACAERQAPYEKITKSYEGSDQSSLDAQAPISRPSVEYTSDDLRDPFQGVNTKPAASRDLDKMTVKELPKMTVQGIMWGGMFNQAIINNKVVKAGDLIEGAQVISIEKSKIILLFENSKYTLSVVGEPKPQGPPKQSVP